MNLRTAFLLLILNIGLYPSSVLGQSRVISQEVVRDQNEGYWLGQLVGNYLGFPFENLYTRSPKPILIDRYYNFGDTDSIDLKMNLNDRRAFVHIVADAIGGAWSDRQETAILEQGGEKYLEDHKIKYRIRSDF